jgi:D-amino-acid dehydrogenase
MTSQSRTNVIIIGGGLAGLSSAYYLRRNGFEVRVLEREADAGMATSFANGGMLTPSMSDTWNTPGVHWKMLRFLGRADAPLRLRLGSLHHYFSWGLRFLHNASPERYRRTMHANFLLSAYSVAQTRLLREALKLEYDVGTKGTMKVFRDARSLDAMQSLYAHLRDDGIAFEAVDAAGAARIEPLLAETQNQIAGGLYFPGDETGNAHLFCQELKSRLLAQGVTFEFSTTVEKILVENGQVLGVRADRRDYEAGKVVLAAAGWSRELARPLGINLNIRPVKGYSLSVKIDQPGLMPSLALIDDHLHAAATPLGNILRLAGTAEFANWRKEIDPARIKSLWNFLAKLSPTLSRHVESHSAQEWCGFRPMAADGRPYVGATAVRGLYLNTGHGHLGWTQAAGSASLLSQIMSEQKTDLNPAPYSMARNTATALQ